MDTTLLTFTQLIMAAMPADHSLSKLAKVVFEIAEKVFQDQGSEPTPEAKDWDEIDEAVGKGLLAAQSPETADEAAWHFLHVIRQLHRYGKRDLPYLAPWLLAEVHEILQTPVHRVPSNQKLLSNQRFYTVDLSVHAAAREHHLMELCTYDGKSDLYLIIRQFRETIEGSSNVLLAHNEVEELLALLLQQRFQEIEEKHKRNMAYQDDESDDDQDADEDDETA